MLCVFLPSHLIFLLPQLVETTCSIIVINFTFAPFVQVEIPEILQNIKLTTTKYLYIKQIRAKYMYVSKINTTGLDTLA
jgi:hypothetical protein